MENRLCCLEGENGWWTECNHGVDGVANFRRWGVSLGGMDLLVCKHASSLGPSYQSLEHRETYENFR